jgi:gallate dioxygenase
MWLVMRGAMSTRVKKLHEAYYLPSMTGIAVAIYEDENEDESGREHGTAPIEAARTEYRRHIGHQIAGAERLEGTYPFTLARSVKAFRLNRFLHALTVPAHRERFLTEEEAAFETAGLSAEERDMLRRRDWRALVRYGAIFFGLEKLGAVIGVSNLHIYAAMRGQSLEDFQKTRNAPGALYSVAGASGKPLAWDKPGAA